MNKMELEFLSGLKDVAPAVKAHAAAIDRLGAALEKTNVALFCGLIVASMAIVIVLLRRK